MYRQYLIYIILGYLSGSILFGKVLPQKLFHVDTEADSTDGNPGTFNAFALGGVVCGVLVLLCDIGKGAWVTALCARRLGVFSPLFALVMAAPVFGHAHSLFHRGHGGKAIAVSFGVLIGILPMWKPLMLLVIFYLLSTLLLRKQSNTRKSVYTYTAFAVTSVLILKLKTVALGCLLMAGIVIHKHCLKANEAFRLGKGWKLE